MDMTLKTKDVSKQLGVDPTTVQRWAKYFHMNCELNEYGHYLFNQGHVTFMQDIKQQLQSGKTMKEVEVSNYSEMIKAATVQQYSKADYHKKLTEVLVRVDQIEERLTQKADEVVSYQLLKHRTEIEEIKRKMTQIEQRMIEMEQKFTENSVVQTGTDSSGKLKKKTRRLFSF